MNKDDVISVLEKSDVGRDVFSLLSRPKDFAYNLVQENQTYRVFWMEKGLKSYIGGMSGEFESFSDAAKTFLDAIDEDYPLQRD